MEKTIEQQIAEGVAQGIHEAKNDEQVQKRAQKRATASGYIIFFLTAFLTFSLMVIIRTIGIKTFGMNEQFLHSFSYPIAIISQLCFSFLFFREDFKTNFGSALFGILINTFGTGYLVSIAF